MAAAPARPWAGLVDLGRTWFGTPVLVNRGGRPATWYRHRRRLPQHSTGFGGGSKLTIGVLGKRSIVALHYRHPSRAGS
jgi:nickel-dependent lactate racemase